MERLPHELRYFLVAYRCRDSRSKESCHERLRREAGPNHCYQLQGTLPSLRVLRKLRIQLDVLPLAFNGYKNVLNRREIRLTFAPCCVFLGNLVKACMLTQLNNNLNADCFTFGLSWEAFCLDRLNSSVSQSI